MTKLNEAAFETPLCQALIESGYDKPSSASDWDGQPPPRQRVPSEVAG